MDPTVNDSLGLFDMAFDENCLLTVSHSQDLVFSANMSELVFTGYGTADSNPDEILRDGNLVNFPTVKEESKPVMCPSLKEDGGVMQFDGQIDIPLLEAKVDSDTVSKKTRYKRVGVSTTLSQRDDKVHLEVKIQDDSDDIQFIGMRYDGHQHESFYGVGLQPTVWNFKNMTVPIMSSEGGIGRGLQPVTKFLNTFGGHAGGNEMTTYTASWSYLSSRKHHVSFDTSAIG